MKRHIEQAPGSDRERAAHIAKSQSRLGSINYRFVASGCAIDKVTSAEIASRYSLPSTTCRWRRVLAKKMWCTAVPVAPPGGEKNTNYRFSRFFVRSVPLFRPLMLTPMPTHSLSQSLAIPVG